MATKKRGVVDRALHTFCSRAAGGDFTWHPRDMDRFYEFTLLAHRYRRQLSGHEVRELLVKRGVTKGDADRLARYYEFGRKLLSYTRSGYRLFPKYNEQVDPDDEA